ncbi:MAG: AAA family ATPase [Planctomycetota bacterium]|jgi:MoxR-like ATPase
MAKAKAKDSGEGKGGAEVGGEADVKAVERLREGYDKIRGELGKVIVGQEEVVEQLLISIFSRGHCILEGVPGLAKTLMVSTLANTLSLSFKRIQFTPDLMPSDITGTEVIQENRDTGEREFRFIRGPLFANVILADEINRTPPKTQAALLEAMQERQVTAGGERYPMENPFFVLATQNPIEQEGTYPLPEAQLDRFMFKITVRYPKYDEEYDIAMRTTVAQLSEVGKVLSGSEILALQDIVMRMPVTPHVVRYVLDLVRATRVSEGEVPPFINDWLTWGAGPRACQYIILGAKALAMLKGRFHVSVEDAKEVAHPVLRHRIITNFAAESEGIRPDDVISKLIEVTPEKEGALDRDGRFEGVLKS